MKHNISKERIEQILKDGKVKIGSKQFDVTPGVSRNLCKDCYFEDKDCPKPAIDICNSGNYILKLK